MAATLGVPTIAYAPFALFNIVNPIITIIFATLGWRMLTSNAVEEDRGPEKP
jgi:NhaC family Na+:H+ antiporter